MWLPVGQIEEVTGLHLVSFSLHRKEYLAFEAVHHERPAGAVRRNLFSGRENQPD